MRAQGLLVALAVALAACAASPPPPAALDTRSDACAWCRMTVSDRRFAAQLVAPAEEPRFFDDLGCLADYLRGQRALPARAVAYVADHRTEKWASAAAAVFVRCPSLGTPMASGLVAYADSASRAADLAAAGCEGVPSSRLLPGELLAGGTP